MFRLSSNMSAFTAPALLPLLCVWFTSLGGLRCVVNSLYVCLRPESVMYPMLPLYRPLLACITAFLTNVDRSIACFAPLQA